jgi:hypothetical protein
MSGIYRAVIGQRDQRSVYDAVTEGLANVETVVGDSRTVEIPDGAAEQAEAPAPSGSLADQALGARLVALQMAVAGGNRGEVESHLRRAFELDDPRDILDDIFGSGTDSDKRVVWPEVG